jgi:hypothetical protein
MKDDKMNHLMIFLGIFAAWFFIQGWLLPRIGVAT